MAVEWAYFYLYRFLCHCWHWRYLIVIPALVVAVAMAGLSAFSRTQYRSSTSLLLQESALANPFLKDLSVEVKLKERIAGLNALLHSRYVMAEVAQETGLVTEATPAAEQEMIQQRLSQATQMELVGDALVKLSLVWPDAAEARLLLNAISESFQKRLMAPGQRAVDNSEIFLKTQLQRQEQALAEVETKLAAFKQEHASLLPGLLGATNMALLEAETQIRTKRIELEGAQARLAGLKTQLSTANPIVGEIEKQIVRTRAQLAMLKSRYTARHSKVRGVQARINQLQQEKQKLMTASSVDTERHLDELWQLATSFEPDQADGGEPRLLVSQLQQLQESSNQVATLKGELEVVTQHKQSILARMGQSADVERELMELERLAEGRRLLYQELLTRYEKAQVTGQLGRFEAPDKVRVIDQPNLPKRSINRPWWLNGLLGLFGGVGFGLAMVTASMLLDRRVYHKQQVLQLGLGPVLVKSSLGGA
ncbi:GumC family protein [Ferrimonas kyonanensis]|uniref:GumC family protein n=1 Tax=Ferrimonas kyonanensis TaxID=364763 RepID=UPI0003FCF7BE|nr:hypothetical protein [Ferrimonas kyonanensis]